MRSTGRFPNNGTDFSLSLTMTRFLKGPRASPRMHRQRKRIFAVGTGRKPNFSTRKLVLETSNESLRRQEAERCSSSTDDKYHFSGICGKIITNFRSYSLLERIITIKLLLK